MRRYTATDECSTTPPQIVEVQTELSLREVSAMFILTDSELESIADMAIGTDLLFGVDDPRDGMYLRITRTA